MEELLEVLRKKLPANAILVGEDVPERSFRDWSLEVPGRPAVLLRPAETEEVSAALATCYEGNLKVAPQGGMTGICGGSTPGDGWAAISLERMVGIEEIDVVNMTMTVKAGTPLETIQKAADEAGLFFPLDLGARGSCTIGGNIATNAGGTRVIRYGMTRSLVLGLEVVLPDGTIMKSLNKLLKNNAGYDLKQLFIGSEGTLGIITRAVLRLAPKPRSVVTAVCALSSFEDVADLLTKTRAKFGQELSAFEVMWSDFWDVVTKKVKLRSPVSADHELYALVEMHGSDEEVDVTKFQAFLEEMMEQGVIQDAAIAQSLAQTEAFWGLRDSGAEFGAAIGPHVSYDVGMSVEHMDGFVHRCKSALSEALPGCGSVFYGHIGDGNLHLDAWVAGRTLDKQLKTEMDKVVYDLVQELGGTISAEHGIGTSKAKWLRHSRSDEEIALMKVVKQALDPKNLLNPGKVLK